MNVYHLLYEQYTLIILIFCVHGAEGVDITKFELLFLLLYADDITIFPETAEGLQKELVMLDLCFLIQYFMSFKFYNHLDGEEIAGCFTLIVSKMSCDCKCSMALPHGAMGWSAVCNCDIS